MTEHMRRYVVRFVDAHPQWGGVTETMRFDYLSAVQIYVEREVEAARELGMGQVTFTIIHP